jgi:Helix-turn-helix.
MKEFNTPAEIFENAKLAKEDRVMSFAQLVGINLKKARIKAGYKDAIDVARVYGINNTQLSHFECGRRIPSLIVFQDLCILYHVEPQEILAVNIGQIGGKLAHDFNLSVPDKKGLDNDIY